MFHDAVSFMLRTALKTGAGTQLCKIHAHADGGRTCTSSSTKSAPHSAARVNDLRLFSRTPLHGARPALKLPTLKRFSPTLQALDKGIAHKPHMCFATVHRTQCMMLFKAT